MHTDTAAEIAELRELIARSADIIRRADRQGVRLIAQSQRRQRREMQDRLDALLAL